MMHRSTIAVEAPKEWKSYGKAWLLTRNSDGFVKAYYVHPNFISFNTDMYGTTGMAGCMLSDTFYDDNPKIDDELPATLILDYATEDKPNVNLVVYNQTMPVTDTSGTNPDGIQEFPTLIVQNGNMETIGINGCISSGWAEIGTISSNELYANYVSASNMKVSGQLEHDGRSYTTITSGTGKISLTTGATGETPSWCMIGNVASISIQVKCAGAVASGANIAVGKVTGVPKPLLKAGVRGASYYGDNANITYMGTDGTFYARNCGKDSLVNGNDARLNATYITDGTML